MEENNNNNVNNNNSDNIDETKFTYFLRNYGGAAIGAIIALILCFTSLYKVLVWIVIIVAGGFIGNYVQKNKEVVKEKVKNFVDKV